MADSTARGRFVWHELMTPNSAGAHEFYSKALGWKTEPWEQDPSYSMFAAESGPLAGSTESHEGAPCWVPYIEVPDVDATIQQATELGGSMTTEPATMSNGGRHAALTDPQGALFGIYSSSAESGPETDPGHGEFSWHELATTDNLAAFDFYAALFGWQKQSEYDMGPMGIYLIFGRNGKQAGGIFSKGDAGKPGPAYWLSYVRVKDVREAVRKVEAERGSLVNGPMEVPGGDWIAQLMDPHGALFAVHTSAADMKAAEKQDGAGKPIGETPVAETPAERKAEPRKTSRPAKKKAAKKKVTSKKAAGKKAVSKKSPGKKAGAKKSAAKRPGTKKSVGKKAGTKKSPAKKAAKKKSATKKAGTRQSRAKKVGTKKAHTKRAATKKAATKKRSTAGRNKKSTKAGKRKTTKRR